jgi:hypothetical protein
VLKPHPLHHSWLNEEFKTDGEFVISL